MIRTEDPPTAGEAEPASFESGRIVIGKPERIEGMEGFYNPAAWRFGDKTCLLGRDVKMAAEEPATEQEFTTGGEPIIGGGPDVGSIVLKVLGPDGKIISDLTKVLYEPKVGEPSYEDFRALLLDDGRLIFGLTWVEPNGTPYPAVLITTTEELIEGKPIEPQIIRVLGSGDQTTPLDEEGIKLPGKNFTPIGKHPSDSDIDKYSFIFRPDGPENRHRFQVFDFEGGVVKHQQYIELPKDKKWGEWAMGTCMPPEWTDKTHQEAFTLIHGITIVNGEFSYATVSARMFRGNDGLLAIDNIDDEPLLKSTLFDDVVQRHPERDAFYTVGWVPYRDEDGNLVRVEVFGSPGDSRTDRIFLDPRERIRNWKRPELAAA